MIEGLFQPIHLVLILAVILIVFGAGKLPEMGGALGRGIREFRSEVQNATDSTDQVEQPARFTPTVTTSSNTAAIFCTSCGERVASEAKFCPNCGTSRAVSEIAAEPDVPAIDAPTT